jgi:hypothetical protein
MPTKMGAPVNKVPWAWFCFWALLTLALVVDAFWQWRASGNFMPMPILLLPGPLVAAGRAFAKARRPFSNFSSAAPSE